MIAKYMDCEYTYVSNRRSKEIITSQKEKIKDGFISGNGMYYKTVDENDLTMHDKLMDVLVDLDLEYDQVISPSLIEKKHFEKWKNVLPYYKNIENEGIVLWKAA